MSGQSELRDGQHGQELAALRRQMAEVQHRLARAERTGRERVAQIAENIPGAVYEFVRKPDGSQAITLMTEGGQALYGRPVDELADPARVFDSVHPDDLAGFVQSIDESARSMATWRREFRNVMPDGSVKWLKGTSNPHLEQDGSIIWNGVLLDITDRKQAELALRESQKRFRNFYQAAPVGILQYELMDDERLVFRGYNPAAELIVGVDCAQFMGRTIEEAFPPLAETEIPERYREVARSGKSWHVEEVLYDYGGIHGVYDVLAFQTSPYHVAVTFRDVTDRYQAQQERAQQEAKLASIFRAAPVGIGMVINRVFAEVNDVLVRMLGYGREELLGQSAKMIYPNEEEFLRVGQVKYDEIRQTGTGTIETKFQRKDGEIRDVLLSSSPLDPDDWSKGVTFTALDITERLAIEDQLRQSQKMEAVGQLAGGIAHDFNNLLQVILGYSDICLYGLNEDKPSLREPLGEIKRAGERAADLTRQLLTFSRRQTLQPRTLNLNEVIDDLAKMLRRVLGEHIHLTVHTAPNVPPVHADPTQLEQILINLCVNARDAMPDGGELVVETARTSAKLPTRGQDDPAVDCALLIVRDTGRGIDPEIRDRVFEPFFTTKGVGQGTGLGLATVYAIVKQHRGSIELDSKLGRGTTFRVTLPASSEPIEVIERPEPGPDLRGRGQTILLAEDDRSVSNLAADVLQRADYEVITARDGLEAARIVEEQGDRIDLALLDVVMPEKSGKYVYDLIRGRGLTFPVLFSSGYSHDALDSNHIPEDARLIQKPYGPARLLAEIQRSLSE